VWHEAMMPDVNKHMDKRIEKELSDLSKNFKTALEEKIRVLEEKMAEREKNPKMAFRTSIRGTAGVRSRNSSVPPPSKPVASGQEVQLNNLSVNTTLPGSIVSPAELISALSEKSSSTESVTVVVEGEDNEYSKKT